MNRYTAAAKGAAALFGIDLESAAREFKNAAREAGRKADTDPAPPPCDRVHTATHHCGLALSHDGLCELVPNA